MKSFYYLLGAAAIALASCSESTELETNPINNNLATKGTGVTFGTYSAKSTRAGKAGSITTEVLKDADYGFGVFAYSTGTADYSTSATPNFMWNQKVTYNNGTANTAGDTPEWIYEPVKFWPNANSDADDEGATGTPTSSKISFFAYAPYAGDASTGVIPSGETSDIVATSANNATGHPTVTYVLASTGKTVDLLWGTAASTTKYTTVDGATIELDKAADDALANTNINITKLKVGQKIKFNFKHALAKIGGSPEKATTDPSAPAEDTKHGLQVMLDIDADGAITGGIKPNDTKVTIKTIKIQNFAGTEDYNGDGTTGNDGDKILNKGTLDLATGQWTIDASAVPATIDHQITSPASSTAETSASAATIATNLAEPATVATGADGFTALPAGVLVEPQNVYATEANPLVFIPGTKPSFKVTIEYVVRTKDAHLVNGYSEAVQTISKMVAFPNVELNKKYNLVMHLGLTSVKFTATVENWETTDATWNDANNNGVVDAGEVTDLSLIHI